MAGLASAFLTGWVLREHQDYLNAAASLARRVARNPNYDGVRLANTQQLEDLLAQLHEVQVENGRLRQLCNTNYNAYEHEKRLREHLEEQVVLLEEVLSWDHPLPPKVA